MFRGGWYSRFIITIVLSMVVMWQKIGRASCSGLMDNKVILDSSERVHIGEGTTDCAVLLCTKRGVIPLDIDGTIIIINIEDPPLNM